MRQIFGYEPMGGIDDDRWPDLCIVLRQENLNPRAGR